jgi:glycosyltransferase involved in cell wall biosynthesis/2-polyprenyl-3-methyl-5-hydroxy-6-metoxy-1,4-benzoquinol methylase
MKLDVRFVIPGLALQMPDPLAVSLGGSETAGLQLARALVERGHRVIAFANVEKPEHWRGVMLLPLDAFQSMAGTLACDLLLVQRNPRYFAVRTHAKASILWVHDLMQARRTQELMATVHGIDRIMTVSEFQRDQYLQLCTDLAAEDFLVSRNGIDLEVIEKATRDVKRVPDRLIYTNRPERGLEVLLGGILPRLLQARPGVQLHVAAYDMPNPAIEPYYRHLRQLAAGFGDRVVWHEPLGKAELYRLMASGSAAVYPTPAPIDPGFNETSCITAMEAMACGLPWISTDRGALPETVGDAGILVPTAGAPHAGAPQVVEDLVTATLRVLEDRDYARHLSVMGRHRAAELSWGGVAQQVEAEVEAIVRRACSDPFALARHFYQRQDIQAAFRVVAQYERDRDHWRFAEGPDPRMDRFAEELRARYAHALSREALAELYDTKVGPNNGHITEGLLQAPPSRFKEAPFSRYARMRDMIAERSPLAKAGKPLRILDWGCSQGECAIVLANSFPGSTVVGIDASSDEIARARGLADKFCDEPSRIAFYRGHEGQLLPAKLVGGHFDVIVMAEVLEHVFDPTGVIQGLEAVAAKGALILISTPFGPWETQQPKTHPRQHIREFEVPDFEDLLRKKPGFILDQVADQWCPVTGLPLGNTYCTYFADGAPLGELDWDRKLTQQRPRQTLSACMMVGGRDAADNLHWCLRSIAPIVDEIVIADCGMGEEARRIALQYGAVLFEHASPLEVGFETPRNAALERCRGDWILMIDADEKLISPALLWRYLRESPVHTFAIRQCHFAVDAAWPPDIPGRLFRRRPERKSGKPMRFWGMLHEHAEIGINEGTGCATLLPDVALAHVGYVDNSRRGERYARNLPMLARDLAAYPKRKLSRMIVMRDSMIRAKEICVQAGRHPGEHGCAAGIGPAMQLCQDVIRTWDQFFADDDGMMATQAVDFYHDACRCLGSQIAADVVIAIMREGIGGASPQAQFYASIDHVERRVRARLKAAVAPVNHEHW